MVGPRGHGRPLHRRGRSRLLRHQRPLAAECARGLSSAAADPFHRHGRRTAAGRSGPTSIRITLKRDPQTLAAVYIEDTARKIYLELFGRGYEYSVLGLFRDERPSLRDRQTPRQPLFLLGRRPARPLRLQPHHAGHADLAVGRPRRRVPVARCIGVLLGGISGYYGGRIDFVIQRVIEFVLSLPSDPDLARAGRRAAAGLAGDAQLFHDHASSCR